MIAECFTHCPGIGPGTDNRLRDKGFYSWQDCLEKPEGLPLGERRRDELLAVLHRSEKARLDGEIAWFVENYPPREHWRILAEYFKEATFFDIETTGLSWHESHASVITALHRGEVFVFRHGENLDDFLDCVDEARLLVTFNGNCFDIPFLEKTFNIPDLGRPHVDLRWVAYHRGYRGGLKYIEEVMGISRPAGLVGVDGYEAVDLYYRWKAGSEEAGETLTAYCIADTLSTCLVSQRLIDEYGFPVEVDDAEFFFERYGVADF